METRFQECRFIGTISKLKVREILEDTIYEERLVGYSFAGGERAPCLC